MRRLRTGHLGKHRDSCARTGRRQQGPSMFIHSHPPSHFDSLQAVWEAIERFGRVSHQRKALHPSTPSPLQLRINGFRFHISFDAVDAREGT